MKRFDARTLRAIDATKYFHIRCGTAHRYIGIWVVVVDGRVFVRPWNDKRSGWYRAFLAEPLGSVKVGEREVRVRARKARGERLNDAVDRAYSGKYTTKANLRYVRGFATAKRRASTLELLPRLPSKVS
ncbi:MAG: DUF2255 family protein [Gemmatimonadaceae bacterium]